MRQYLIPTLVITMSMIAMVLSAISLVSIRTCPVKVDPTAMCCASMGSGTCTPCQSL